MAICAMWRVMMDMYFQGDFKAPIVDMAKQTVVITGPSRGGIGFETALALAQRGAQLLLAARNVEKAEADAELIHESAPRKPKVRFPASDSYTYYIIIYVYADAFDIDVES